MDDRRHTNRGVNAEIAEKPVKWRPERMQSFIQDIAAQFVQRESNHSSMITVTGVIMGDRGNTATILISVLPSDKAKGVVDFLKRKRSEFRELFGEKARHLKPPTFDFEIGTLEIPQTDTEQVA